MESFACPTAKRPVSAVVVVPGSKSLANRALVCAALAGGGTQVDNVPSGDDTVAMLAGLRALGCEINESGASMVFRRGLSLDDDEAAFVHAGLAGTTSRFLTAVAAMRKGSVTIDGLEALRNRPMQDLHEALRALGADVKPLGEVGRLPVTVSRGERSKVHQQARISIDGSTSSQFTTALMLVAPYLSGGMKIRVHGKRVSDSYIMMTVSVMRTFGADVDVDSQPEELVVTIREKNYEPCRYIVEPDASSASYPLAIAAVVGGNATVEHLGSHSLQGDVKFATILGDMGCTVSITKDHLSVSRDTSHALRGIDIDLVDMSDLVPTVAAVALFAESPTRIRGVGFIRNKESDRLGDLANELRKCGAKIVVTDDGLEISPGPLVGATLNVHHDHRLAMAFAVVGCVVSGVIVNDPGVVSKSWPKFWDALQAMVNV